MPIWGAAQSPKGPDGQPLPRDAGPSVLDSPLDKALRMLRSVVGADDPESSVMESAMPGILGAGGAMVSTFADPMIRQLRTSHALDMLQEVGEHLGWAAPTRNALGRTLGRSAPRTLGHVEDIRVAPLMQEGKALAGASAPGSVPGRSVVYLDPERASPHTVLEEVAHGAQRVGAKEGFDPTYTAASRIGGYRANPWEQSAKSTAARLGGAQGSHQVSPTAGRALAALDEMLGPNSVGFARRAVRQGTSVPETASALMVGSRYRPGLTP